MPNLTRVAPALRSVVVELRHDTIVRGTLTDADEEMNLTMQGVTYQPLQACSQRPSDLPPCHSSTAAHGPCQALQRTGRRASFAGHFTRRLRCRCVSLCDEVAEAADHFAGLLDTREWLK